MADVEQTQRPFITIKIQFVPDLIGELPGVPEKCFAIETVVNRRHLAPCPPSQLLRECLAGRDRTVCPCDGTPRKVTLDSRLQPKTVLPSPAQVAEEIGRRVK